MKLIDEKLLFAMEYAIEQHKNQVRKYTNEPYITHCFAVAGLVASTGAHSDVVAAAFLHDIIEDCNVSLVKLQGLIGNEIAQLVNSVTDVSLPLDGKREVRKRLDREHLAMACPEAKTIKLADIINNTKNLAEHDWEFAKVYMNEKRLSLEVLKEGDANLYSVAEGIIEDYYEWMEVCDE